MRTFVEAVLRFGVPPNFAAFIAVVGKKSQAKPVKLRAELMDVFSSSGLFGKNYLSGAKAEKQQGSAATDVGERVMNDDDYVVCVLGGG